jgi:hypothetical protein
MIREKAIHFKLNMLERLNLADSDLFQSCALIKTRCPKCGADGCLSPHASYTRHMVSFGRLGLTDELVKIFRDLCPSCSSTHARIPDNLIPHSPYTLLFVIHALKAYLNRTCTVAELCGQLQISVSTLYRWKALFREHANLLLAAFKQMAELETGHIETVCGIEALPETFSGKFGFSFLQSRKRQAAACGHG